MREILFRGMRLGNGEWVYGYLFRIWDEAYILWGTTNGIPGMIKVDPSTVGQYTGLTDKNGEKIFEGDVITISSAFMTGIVEYHDCGFEVRENDVYECLWYDSDELEVIGNIHDNPELLEGGGER